MMGIENDDIKYLANGQAVSVIEKLPKGYVVANVYEDNDEEWRDDEHLRIVPHVFDKAPTLKFDEAVAALNVKINELEIQKLDLARELHEATVRERELASNKKRYHVLQEISDFLDGKVTHVVKTDYWRIEILEYKRDGYVSLKFSGLESNGKLSWSINEDYGVLPATSYEEALALTKAHILEGVTRTNNAQPVIESAKKFGVTLPSEFVATYEQRQRAELQKKAREAADAHAKATAALAELDANAPARDTGTSTE